MIVEKLKKLLQEMNLDDVPFDISEWNGTALIPLKGKAYVICETKSQQHQVMNFIMNADLKDREAYRVYTAQAFMALLITNFLYIGFHDGMTFSICIGKYKTWFGKPNYRAIQRSFENAGFVWSGK